MAVTYDYKRADGSTTNNPYEYDANGQQTASNQYWGRSDGYDGPITTYATPNQQSYSDPSGGGGPIYRDPVYSGSAGRQPLGGGGQAKPMPLGGMGGSNAQLGGSSGGGYGSSTYGPNPYLQDQANGMQSQVNQNLSQNIMPGIRSSAQANGQYGSSRQGIAEGVAAGNASAGLSSSLAGLYGGAYNTDQANQTQRMGIGANYNLGMGNLGLGYFNAGNNYNLGLGSLGNSATAQNQNFYSQQRAQDLQQYQLGAGMYGSGINGQVGVGTGLYGVGNSAYQSPLTALQQYSNAVAPYTGLNSAQQIDSTKGGGAMGALGGAVAGAQLASNNLGFGNIGGSAGSTQNWTYGGSGTTRSPSSSSDIDAILSGNMYG